MNTYTASAVTEFPAAPPEAAHRHFTHRLSVETDVADVAEAIGSGRQDFVLLDVRSAESFAAGHVPGAVNLPQAAIEAAALAALPDALLVVYCWGPGCNGATKAGAKIASLGRQVKEMLGGFDYWRGEGHPVEAS